MKFKTLMSTGYLFAAIAVVPAIAPAASRVNSQTQESVQLLSDLRDLSHNALTAADRLYTISYVGSSEVHSRVLQLLSDDINDMGRKLAALQVLEGSLPEERRGEVARATAIARNLAADTTRAIQFVADRPGTLWQTPYRQLTISITKSADQLAQLLDRYDEFVRVQSRERELRNSLTE